MSLLFPPRRWARVALIAVALLSPQALFGQRTPPPLRFQRIAHEAGLSNPTVTSISQDAHGLLWVGTQDGLNVHDGVDFTTFRPDPGDSTSLADAWVSSLAPSRDGAMWVGLLGAGVHRLDLTGRRWRRFRHDPDDQGSLASDKVNTLLETTDGTLWVGTGSGLDAIDTATGRVRHYHPSSRADSGQFTDDVLSILEIPGAPLWVGTRLGVYLLDRRTERFQELPVQLLTREIRSMVLDSSGAVWIGAYDDLVAVDSRTLKVLRQYRRRPGHADAPIAHGVNKLSLGHDGRLWIGTDNGMGELDTRTGAFVLHPPDPGDPRSIAGPFVRAVFVDRGGVLWAGLESHGLNKHAPTAVTFSVLRKDSTLRRSLSDSYIRGIATDPEGIIWIATQYGGLNRLDPHTGRITTYRHNPQDPRSLPGDNVWAFLEDRRGVRWVGLHTQGFGRFDPARGIFTRHSAVPSNASVNVLYEDRRGTIWIGLEGRGAIALNADRRTARSFGHSYGDVRTLVGDDIQAILEDRRGRMWLGGATGLTILDPATGATKHFRGKEEGGLAAGFVTNVVEDSRGTVWVATKGGGLHRWNDTTQTFTVYGPRQGLPHSFIYGVLEDGEGHLWLSSDNGLAMLDPVSGFVIRYGLEDGLQAREFNRRAHLRTADGTMYFGGINGVNVFHPHAVTDMATPPAVRLLTLRADGAERPALGLTADSVIQLRHDASSVSLTFAALDYSAPEKTQYAYRLEGIDRDWVVAGNRRSATYAALPVGRHVFRVRAANAAGKWSPREAAVTLVVAPAWWATWWMRALQLLAAASAFVGLLRLRLRAVQRRGAELERLVAVQTRDIVEAQERLRVALARQSEAADKLVEMTAAVPGAVFQMRESESGHRSFEFVSRGIMALGANALHESEDARRAAEELFSRIDPADRPALEQSLETSRRTLDTWRVEVRWSPSHRSGARWFTIQAQASRLPDGSTMWTGVMTDSTSARHAEDERVALEAKVLQAQKEESLAILAGGVAHDFNNLLVSVVMGSELLEMQVGHEPRAADLVRRIRAAGQRASELTQQMLAYTGKGRIAVEAVDLRPLSEEMLSLLRTAVPRTVELEFQADARAAVVQADATQLRQVVLNLVTNAGEAIGDRPGRILVRVDVVSGTRSHLQLLHAAPDMPAAGPFAMLEVSDTGSGIDPALVERIFDPFFTTKFTGRGLGLAALLGIVRGHRGGLRVVSTPGQGTRFQIFLPLAGPAVAIPVPGSASETPMADPDRRRVLVVDDERDVAEIARSVLESLGYEVTVARDGEEALDAWNASDFDVILLDVMMPRMSGTATANTLRSRGANVPIVLMSGYAEDELVTRGLQADVDGYLKKPFLASDLARVVRDALRARSPG